ncbi:hypothetical protein ACQUY5_16525 [Bacillus cereus]|uniref:hypothetical protein n=1 Tax=Bacillus cereus TaxID=1396 RepID=UPI003D1770CE
MRLEITYTFTEDFTMFMNIAGVYDETNVLSFTCFESEDIKKFISFTEIQPKNPNVFLSDKNNLNRIYELDCKLHKKPFTTVEELPEGGKICKVRNEGRVQTGYFYKQGNELTVYYPTSEGILKSDNREEKIFFSIDGR